MAHVMRPLLHWPRWRRRCYSGAAFYHSLPSISLFCSNSQIKHQFLIPGSSFSLSHGVVHFRSNALKLRDVPLPSDSAESDSDSFSDGNSKKSRNVKKREAKRAFSWGVELASFSPAQISRILRVTSLEREVYEALLLVKRLGRDVREGKRRQFNYIGKLLRDVDPELMDGLIQATKDGDEIKFQNLSGSERVTIDDDNDEGEETDYESEEEITQHQIALATRWFDGLINKDIDIMNEIYSLHHIDFDRQELRKLVRKVHSTQENQVTTKENGDQGIENVSRAKRSLSRFLRNLVKHLAAD